MEKDGNLFLTQNQIILISKRHAEHLFGGQNTQQQRYKQNQEIGIKSTNKNRQINRKNNKEQTDKQEPDKPTYKNERKDDLN